MRRMTFLNASLLVAELLALILAPAPVRAGADDPDEARAVTTRAEVEGVIIRFHGPLRIADPVRPLPREWQPRRQLAGTYRDPFARHVFVRHTHAWYPPYGFGWYGWFGPRAFVPHHYHAPVYRLPVRPPPVYGPRYLPVP